MFKLKEERICIIVQIVLTVIFLFHFYSVYRHDLNSANNLSLLILFLFLGFSQPETKNKIFSFLPKLNTILFVVWLIIIIAQLFI